MEADGHKVRANKKHSKSQEEAWFVDVQTNRYQEVHTMGSSRQTEAVLVRLDLRDVAIDRCDRVQPKLKIATLGTSHCNSWLAQPTNVADPSRVEKTHYKSGPAPIANNLPEDHTNESQLVAFYRVERYCFATVRMLAMRKSR